HRHDGGPGAALEQRSKGPDDAQDSPVVDLKFASGAFEVVAKQIVVGPSARVVDDEGDVARGAGGGCDLGVIGHIERKGYDTIAMGGDERSKRGDVAGSGVDFGGAAVKQGFD